MEKLYENPKYYDIAFSFRNLAEEVDLFEAVIARYSKVPVTRMLEVASGQSPHLEELAKRGYEYVGLDLSEKMIEYAEGKAKEIGARADFHIGDIADFTLPNQADFGFILLGSLYGKDTRDVLSHFNAMGKVIRRGGLYLLDWCVSFAPLADYEDSWEMESEGIRVKTTYQSKPVDFVEQRVEETITLDVDDHGKRGSFVEKAIRRVIFPQEFLLLVGHQTSFEFMGWWNNWNLDKPLPVEETVTRPIIVLRRE
jgi:SAM-dependent methyltransferase